MHCVECVVPDLAFGFRSSERSSAPFYAIIVRFSVNFSTDQALDTCKRNMIFAAAVDLDAVRSYIEIKNREKKHLVEVF